MKTISLFVIISLNVALVNASGQSANLQGIQQKIEQAFYASFAEGNISKLSEIIDQLKQEGSPSATYWHAYAKYFESIYYLKTDNKGKSESAINEGVEILSKLKNKNSEDYALLVLMQNFSMQFITNMMKMGVVSGKISENVEKAIKADPNNLRAYYAAAANDFYTPEQYGGGTKAENYLLKAIALNNQPVDDASLPTWGKDQAYQMLVALYLKKGNMGLAKKYLEEAIQLYPNNYGLAELAKKVTE